MSQKIFAQMRNEWRSNLWLAVELLVVSVVLWYVLDFVYTRAALYVRPMGTDVENCFLIKYDAEETEEDDHMDVGDVRRQILDRLKRHPDIEAACLTNGAYPYSGSYWGGMIAVDTLTVGAYTRYVTPDYAEVFRITGLKGESSKDIVKMLEEGKRAITRNLLPKKYDPLSFIGKRAIVNGDSLNTVEIGAVVAPIRRENYEESNDGSVLIPMLPEQYGMAGDFCVRVKPGAAADFAERFAEVADKEFTVGRFFVNDVKSFDTLRADRLRGENFRIRNYVILMGFLLINIFMGLLGTFWFRTRMRVKDIAMRKTVGATEKQIFRLLIGEGLLLLTIVTPIALLIDANIAHMELNTMLDGEYFNWARVLLCGLAAYALMALMIFLGIAIPARNAMKTAPAEALKDE